MISDRKYDLEDRLVKFAIMILEVCNLLPNIKAVQNILHQLSRSGTAPALLYDEAQAAESRNDFTHKMKILLKELRETRITLRIINEKPVVKHNLIEATRKEGNESIGIFHKKY